MVDPDPRTAGSGLRRLADAGIDVSVGVEGAACQALNAAFVHRVSQKVSLYVMVVYLAGSLFKCGTIEQCRAGMYPITQIRRRGAGCASWRFPLVYLSWTRVGR